MTKICVEEDGRRRVLSAQGHATGHPDVCAAISSILFSLAGWLENARANPAKHWIECFTCRMESGDVMLDFAGDDDMAVAFDLAVIGLLQLEKAYPELIQVEAYEN